MTKPEEFWITQKLSNEFSKDEMSRAKKAKKKDKNLTFFWDSEIRKKIKKNKKN
jgi:hypothetical protein